MPLLLLGLGSMLYILGAMVYATRRPDPWPQSFGFHEVFHSLVIAAAASHFLAMVAWIVPGASGPKPRQADMAPSRGGVDSLHKGHSPLPRTASRSATAAQPPTATSRIASPQLPEDYKGEPLEGGPTDTSTSN